VFKSKKKKFEEQFIEDEIVVSTSKKTKIFKKTTKEPISEPVEEEYVYDEIVVSMSDIASVVEKKTEEQSQDIKEEIEDDEGWGVPEQDDSELIEEDDSELVIPEKSEQNLDPEPVIEEQGETNESPTEDGKSDELEDYVPSNNQFVPKKELGEYFEEDRKKSKKLRVKDKKDKKQSKRQLRRAKEFADIKDRRIFRYDNKKYNKVEDFIKYLNDHYKDIDDVASEIMNDENFFGWINKKSGFFDDSLKKFKEIKEKIEK